MVSITAIISNKSEGRMTVRAHSGWSNMEQMMVCFCKRGQCFEADCWQDGNLSSSQMQRYWKGWSTASNAFVRAIKRTAPCFLISGIDIIFFVTNAMAEIVLGLALNPDWCKLYTERLERNALMPWAGYLLKIPGFLQDKIQCLIIKIICITSFK